MDLGHLFIDTVTYATGMAFVDGDLTPSGTATATGRWEEHYKVITLAGGEERVSTHRFSTATAIPLHAHVWGPDADTGDDGDALRVLTRRYAKTLDGGYAYYIIELGR